MTAQVWDLPTGPEFIRSHRTRKNMSQRDLAASVGGRLDKRVLLAVPDSRSTTCQQQEIT